MIRKILRYLYGLRTYQRITMALVKGAHASTARNVDLADPASWEFSGFSQNGEDGILDVLWRQLKGPNRYFLEIGASDGIENNTTWLSLTRRFSGIWVDGHAESVRRAVEVFGPLNYGVQIIHQFVMRDNAGALLDRARYRDPDVFSLDVDGMDYYLVNALLSAGMRPRICVVEYNSTFGPERCATIPYREDFAVRQRPGDSLYYGCSIAGWRALFARFEYRFITVDTSGVNAFFVDPAHFDDVFLDGVHGSGFVESVSHAREYLTGWREQVALLDGRPLVEIPAANDRTRGSAAS